MKTLALLLALLPLAAGAQSKLEDAPAPAAAPAAAPAPKAHVDVPLPPPPVPRKPAKVTHRLAVLDFSLAGSAHPDLARVLADAAAAGAAASPDHQVLAQGEIVALLGLERTRQMLGCTDDQGCLTELAGALDSDRLLSGSLTILERTSLLTVRLIDVKKSRTLGRVTATLLDATEPELVDAARRLGHEALTGQRLDTTGVVRVTVDRPGATVTLDGKELGASPLKESPRVLEGPHTITVQKAGYVRWSTTVHVPAGGTVPVAADLVPIQLLGEAARSRLWTWGWVGTGVAGAAGASAIYFGAKAHASYADYKAATTRTAATDLRDKTRTNATLSNVSWGVSGVAAAGAGWLLISAMIEDARAATPPDLAPAPRPARAGLTPVAVPLDGGAVVGVAGRF